jgi:phospholipase C
LFVLLGGGSAVLGSGCKSNQAPPSYSPSAGEKDDDNEDPTDGLGEEGTPPPMPAAQTPIPSKIRYVMVLVKENHTFDNYFTDFPGAESVKTAKLSNGSTITRKQAPTELMKDICHSNACGQTAYADGKMNAFDARDPVRPFYFYSEKQIPNYWRYARNFVLADHFFSTTMGPSTPGHTVFWAAQSLVLDNAKCEKDRGECKGAGCKAGADIKITSYDPDKCTTKRVSPCFDVPSLTDHLPKDFTWADYGGPIASMIKSATAAPDSMTHFRKQNELLTDLQAGHLANLTVGHLWSGDVSEHPAAYPCDGENFTVDIVNAAMKLPQWKEMAIVITWDDYGGWFDHVKPPVKKCANGQVFQSGFRLPAIVISPYAKKGLVLKTPTEQASVPKLVEELWGMEFMSKRDPHARDGSAGSLMGAFDFNQAPREPLLLEKHTCPP